MYSMWNREWKIPNKEFTPWGVKRKSVVHLSAPQLSTTDPELPTFWGPFAAKSLLTKGQIPPNVFEEENLFLWFCTQRSMVLLENAILWPFRHNGRSLAAFRNVPLT